MTVDRSGNLDYKVADLSLADFGRKEIQLAEHEMPGLMAMRKEFGAKATKRRTHHWFFAHDNSNSCFD